MHEAERAQSAQAAAAHAAALAAAHGELQQGRDAAAARVAAAERELAVRDQAMEESRLQASLFKQRVQAKWKGNWCNAVIESLNENDSTAQVLFQETKGVVEDYPLKFIRERADLQKKAPYSVRANLASKYGSISPDASDEESSPEPSAEPSAKLSKKSTATKASRTVKQMLHSGLPERWLVNGKF